MIEIVAGTPPGGGLDRTARALAKALDEAQAFAMPVVVRNVPGDGARKAWAYMDEHRGGSAHTHARGFRRALGRALNGARQSESHRARARRAARGRRPPRAARARLRFRA